MATIGSIDVVNDRLSTWGVVASDYVYNGKQVDFQDLMVRITERRATAVESEIKPMSTRMTKRNEKLEKLGTALSELSAFVYDDDNKLKESKKFSQDACTAFTYIAASYGYAMGASGAQYTFTWKDGSSLTITVGADISLSKSDHDKLTQFVKSQIDAFNNAASTDMTRLQSLVDKRDESYSTATSLMQAIGDTRSSLIKNL